MLLMPDAPLRRALVLEWYTIGWTMLAGAAGFYLGIQTRSVSLTAFGIDSIVELICAGVLVQRLGAALGASPLMVEASERRAARIVGALLLLAAAYVTVEALWHLLHHTIAQYVWMGMLLTAATVPVMLLLGNGKLALSRELASRALRADAIGNVVCWYLAVVVLVGVVLYRLFHWWWLDGAASLVIVIVLVLEGLDAWRGRAVGDRCVKQSSTRGER